MRAPAMNITEPIRARAHALPDAIAVIHADGSRVGFGAFDRTIDAVAHRILSEGIGSGDFVAAAPLGEYADLVVRLALARIGAAVAPRVMPPSRARAAIGSKPGEFVHAHAITAGADWFAEPPSDVDPIAAYGDGAAVACLFSTSGTTGEPRVIPVTHDMMSARVEAAGHAILHRSARQITVPTVRSGFGFVARLRVLWESGTLVTAPVHPHDIVESVRRHEVDHLVLLPFWVPLLVAALPPGERPLPSLACIEFGGAALPAPALELARSRLCDDLWDVYGVTEGGYVATARFGTLDHEAGEAGRVVPGVEVRAFGPDGTPLAPDVEGRLRMRGPGFVHEYLDDPGRSAEVFRDGWFEPGDVGSVSAGGVVRIGGRESHVLNVGGYKIHAGEIEQALAKLDWVRDVAVFGVDDELGITQIAAAVVPARRIEPADLDALRAHPLPMPTILMPLRALPRNENGKVRRDELVAMVIAHRPAKPKS